MFPIDLLGKCNKHASCYPAASWCLIACVSCLTYKVRNTVSNLLSPTDLHGHARHRTPADVPVSRTQLLLLVFPRDKALSSYCIPRCPCPAHASEKREYRWSILNFIQVRGSLGHPLCPPVSVLLSLIHFLNLPGSRLYEIKGFLLTLQIR